MTDADAGLTVTDTHTVDAAAVVRLDGQPVTDVHRAVADATAVREALLTTVRDGLAGRTPAEARRWLRERGVTALGGLYADLCVGVARGDPTALNTLLRTTRRLGSGQTPVDLRTDQDDLHHAHTPLLAAAEATPTVVVRLTDDLREQRPEQRRDVCRYLAALAEGCDVQVVGTGRLARWFVHSHRADLPVSVGEDADPHRSGPTPDDAAVAEAVRTLDADSREVRVLRLLADDSTHTLPYGAFSEAFQVDRSTWQGCLSELSERDLLRRWGPRGDRRAELTKLGSAVLDALDPHDATSGGSENSVDESRQSPHNHRVSAGEDERGDHPPADAADRPADSPSRHGVSYLPRHRHVAAAGTPPDGAVVSVSRPVSTDGDGREPAISYDAPRGELVVSADFHTPLQFTTCIARALTDGRVRSTALTEANADRLLSGDRRLLRDARQLGWLGDDVTDGSDWWDALVDAREDLLDLTKAVADGDDDSARSEALRLAHGLAGTVVHALDRLGVDVVREVRLPNYHKYDTDKRATVARTLAHMVGVQSRYGDYSAFRQLLEDRDHKRATAMSPHVDAADPEGELIGSMTVVGKRAEDLGDRLRERLSGRDAHPEAPEFRVPVPLHEAGQPATARVLSRLCGRKGLRRTRRTTALLHAYTSDPYAVVQAVERLGGGNGRRRLRPQEVRYALSTLPTDRLLPGARRSEREITAVLLAAERPLTPQEVADRSGLSRRTVRRRLPALLAAGLAVETDDGERVRLTLPFRSERGVVSVDGDAEGGGSTAETGETDALLPALATDGVLAAQDVVPTVAEAVATDPEVLADLDALGRPPVERLSAYAAVPGVGPWVSVVVALATATWDDLPSSSSRPAAQLGPTPRQRPVTGAARRTTLSLEDTTCVTQ